MVLSDADIREAIEEGALGIEPFEGKCLTPNGYDLRIESVFIPKFRVEANQGTVMVPPQTWFVVSTVERIKLSRRLSAQLWLRTTWARQGIMATFGKIDAGFEGTLTLNAFNASNLTFELPVGERFCQMVVERLDSPAEASYPERSGRYQNQKGVTLTPKDGKANEEPTRGPVTGKAVPTEGEQPCRRHDCTHCCLKTEMPLSNEDIKRISALGFDQGVFSELRDGWVQLKNSSEGRCYFLEGKLCSIYPYRPEGCTLYPIVFEADTADAIFDIECPHAGEFVIPNELRRRVTALVDKLKRERRDRRYRKVSVKL